MTLFIACILIHHFAMSVWWYPVATAIWLLGFALQYWWTHEDNVLIRRRRSPS